MTQHGTSPLPDDVAVVTVTKKEVENAFTPLITWANLIALKMMMASKVRQLKGRLSDRPRSSNSAEPNQEQADKRGEEGKEGKRRGEEGVNGMKDGSGDANSSRTSFDGDEREDADDLSVTRELQLQFQRHFHTHVERSLDDSPSLFLSNRSIPKAMSMPSLVRLASFTTPLITKFVDVTTDVISQPTILNPDRKSVV